MPFGPQFFTQTPAIMINQRISGIEDIGGGTVILFKAYGFAGREMAGEIANILNLRPTPAIN